MFRKIAGILCILSSVILAIVGGYLFGPRLLDYKKARDMYNDVESTYTSKPNNENDDLEEDSNLKNEAIDKKDQNDTDTSKSAFDDDVELIDERNDWVWTGKINNTKLNIGDRTIDLKDYACIDVDSKGLLAENKDYIGWIYIPGTNVSYPVVRSKDNADYLHVNFRGQYNYPGTVFMDCRCSDDELDFHTILYGHNMNDGSMFAQIKSYADEKFFKDHPVFWFITPEEKLLYMVVSSFEASPIDKAAFFFDTVDYKTKDEYQKYLDGIIERSSYKTGRKLNSSDRIMTLSTCTNKRVTRYTVHGVLLGSQNDDFSIN